MSFETAVSLVDGNRDKSAEYPKFSLDATIRTRFSGWLRNLRTYNTVFFHVMNNASLVMIAATFRGD